MDDHEAGTSSYIHRDRSRSRMDSISSSDSSDDDDDMDGAAAPKARKMDEDFYKQFDFRHRSEVQLPIHENEANILNTIEKNPVCILTGDTGCGKTTQVSFFSWKKQFMVSYWTLVGNRKSKIHQFSQSQQNEIFVYLLLLLLLRRRDVGSF